MEDMAILRPVLALVLVLGLIGAAAWAIRRFGLSRLVGAAASGPARLGVVEVRAIDSRHKLVLLRRDDVEHLMLLGPGTSRLVETRRPEASSRGMGA